MLTYRYDPDLEFLRRVSNKELDGIASCLLGANDYKRKFYKVFVSYIYWKMVAKQFQYDHYYGLKLLEASGTCVDPQPMPFAQMYSRVLEAVCDMFKVNYNEKDDVKQKERELLLTLLEKSLGKKSEEERRQFSEKLGLKTAGSTPLDILSAVRTAMMQSSSFALRIAGIVANDRDTINLLKERSGFGNSPFVFPDQDGEAKTLLSSLFPKFSSYNIALAVVRLALLRIKYTSGMGNRAFL